MKKIYGIIAALVLSVAGIAGIVFLSVQNYEVYLVLENEGIAVTDDKITQNLLQYSGDAESLPEEVGASSYEMSDTVYEKNGKLYLGDDKAYLSSAYPLFVNEGSTLYCVTDSIVAVTEDFESVPTYQGLYISEGMSFNQDMERAYRENMLFLELPNGLYMNAMQMSVKQSGLPEVRLENNAILHFREDKLSWYALEEDTFLYEEITGLTEDSYVTINDVNYNYLDLLEMLGVYKDTTQQEGVEEGVTASPNATAGAQMTATPTPTNTPTSTPTPTPTPTPVPANGGVNSDIGEGGGMVRPSATPTPVVTPAGSDQDEEGGVKPTKAPSDREWDGEKSNLPTMTPRPPLPALPAEDAEQVELPPLVEQPEAPEQPDMPESSEDEDEKEEWEKPTVNLGDFSTEVYSIYNEITTVENSAYLHNKGIVYQVYQVSTEAGKKDKLVTRKSATSAGVVRISGLTPDTEYRVEASFFYRTAFGAKEEQLASVTLRTKPMSALPKIEVDFGLGEYYFPKQADLRNVELDHYEETNAFEDMLSAIKKVEIEFDKTGLNLSKAPVYRFSSLDLKKFKDRSTTDILTKEILESSSDYEITFVFYDAKGNAMPVKAFEPERHVYTCKAAPVADIQLKKNEVKGIEVEIKIENEDDALIREGSLYLAVYNRDGQPVYTQGRKKTGLLGGWDEFGEYEGLEPSYEVKLEPDKKTRIEFSNLLDFESYTLCVYADYDIGKLPGTAGSHFEENMEIGKTKVLTAPLSSLGYAFFKVEVTEVSYHSAKVSVALDETRTDYRLVDLLSYCELQFQKDVDGALDATGITVSYADVSALPDTQEPESDDDTGETLEDGSTITDDNEESIEDTTGNTLITAENGFVQLSGKTMDYLKTGAAMEFNLSGLESASKYTFTISPKVTMGSHEHEEIRDVSVYYTPNYFRTLKQTPTVKIETSLCFSDSISLYDVSIQDPDNTIVKGPVYLYVFNAMNQNIASERIELGEKKALLKFNNLEPFHEYTFRFYVTEMNDGYDPSDQKQNHEIYYYRYAETKELLKLTTGQGMDGDLRLLSVGTDDEYNVIKIMADQIKVNTKTDGTGEWRLAYHTSKTYYTKATANNQAYYSAGSVATTTTREEVFRIEHDFGPNGCNAFQVRYSDNNAVPGGKSYTDYELYTEDPRLNPAAKCIARTQKPETDTGAWFRYIYRTEDGIFEDGLVLTGQQTLYLKQIDKAGSKNRIALMAVQFSRKDNVVAGQGYSARMQVTVKDVNLELGDNPAFYLRVYEKESRENNEEDFVLSDYRMYRYANNGQKEKVLYAYSLLNTTSQEPVDTIQFEGMDGMCDTAINYPVKRGFEYRIELSVNVRGYVVSLGEVNFHTNQKVITITDVWDLYGIKQFPNASYVVVNDIEMPKASVSQIIPSSMVWQGTLDFQGHTLTKYPSSALIYTVGSNGVIENLKLKFWDDVAIAESRADLLVYTNNGTIRNLQVIYNLKQTQTASGTWQSLIRVNNTGAVLENFSVKIESPWYFRFYGGVVGENRGTIRNGYVYGDEALRMFGRDMYTDAEFIDFRLAGVIAAANNNGGYIENCFSTVDVYSVENRSASDGGAGLLVGRQQGVLRNCFATGTVYYYDEAAGQPNQYAPDSGIQPLFDSSSTGRTAILSNNHFYSEREFVLANWEKTRQIELASLHDVRWYDALLNRSESSKNGQFDVSPATRGFYPQVKLPDGMMQDWIPLPELPESNEIQLVNAIKQSQDVEEATVVFTFNNPVGARISDVKVRWLDTQIKTQYSQDGFWIVEAVVRPSRTNPGYYSEYDVTGFTVTYEQGATSNIFIAEKDYRKLNVEFYMPVLTVAEWFQILDNPNQNYRLYHDIDFAYIPDSNIVVNSTFAGKLDGYGHTIRNLQIGSSKSAYAHVFANLSGSISNLIVENMTLEANSSNAGKYRGFVGALKGNASIDNVHIIGATITSTYFTGTLVGYVAGDTRATITNSSVQNVTITSKNIGGYKQSVGGMIGETTNTGVVMINNSFADGLNIEVKDASTCAGTGGFIGKMITGSGISDSYIVNSTIFSAFKATGGVIGSVARNTYFTVSSYHMNHMIVDATVSSTSDVLGGFVGYTPYANDSSDVNSLFLGEVYSTNAVEGAAIGRYEGSAGYTLSKPLSSVAKLYTAYSANVDGKLNAREHATDWYKRGEEQPADQTYAKYEDSFVYYSYDELCNIENYKTIGLNLGGQFILNRERLANGEIPKLRHSMTGEELMCQKTHYFPQDAISFEKVEKQSFGTGNSYWITVTVKHPETYEITGVLFDENLLLVPDGNGGSMQPEIHKESATETVLRYPLNYQGWVDRYFLTGITYREAAGTEEQTMNISLETGIEPQYLEIGDAAAWNRDMAKEVYGQKGYNVRITGDLDFTNTDGTPMAVNTGAIVNRLVGQASTDSNGAVKYPTIRGITLTAATESFVSAAFGKVENLNLADISITTDTEEKPNAGVFGTVSADVENLDIQNVTLVQYKTQHNGIIGSVDGKVSDVTMDGVTVISNDDKSKGAGGLVGILTSQASMDNVHAKNVVVRSNKAHVGGIFGYETEASHITNCSIENFMVGSSGGDNVGGIGGYAISGTFGANSKNLDAKNGAVFGTNYVGGIFGQGILTNVSDVENIVDNVFVNAQWSCAGGIAGLGYNVGLATVKNSVIVTLRRSAGSIFGQGRNDYYSTSYNNIVTTVYDRTEGSETNDKFTALYNAQVAEVTAIQDDANADATAKKYAADALGYWYDAGKWKPSWWTKVGYNTENIGGAVGEGNSYRAVVVDCTVGASNAYKVGGIVGRHISHRSNMNSYANAVHGGTVFGTTMVGGVAGEANQGELHSCYSDTTVTASGDYAGGVVGYQTVSYSSGYPIQIYSVYSVSAVNANNYAGGIIGYTDRALKGENGRYIAAGSVSVAEADGVIHPIGTRYDKNKDYSTYYIFRNGDATGAQMALKKGNTVVNVKDIVSGHDITTENLLLTTTYETLLGFSSSYYNWNSVGSGYMPYAISGSRAIQYKDAEGNIRRITVPGYTPASGASLMMLPRAMRASVSEVKLPKLVASYSTGVDRLNLEFDCIAADAILCMEANGKKMAEVPLTQRCYTLAYDYRTELTITLTRGEQTAEYTVEPADASRNVMVWNTDYFYITGEGVAGSRATIAGSFVHLSNGYALAANGDVYDVTKGTVCRKADGISLQNQVIPFDDVLYGEDRIETYYGYSVVNGEVREGMRLYVKDYELFAVSAKMSDAVDYVLVGAEGGMYTTVLYRNKLTDMTDAVMEMPKNFVNSGIAQMTNNLNSDSCYVVVRYMDGAVAGFNYRTGELLPIETVHVYGTNSDTSSKEDDGMPGTNFASAYEDVKAFEEMVTASDWLENEEEEAATLKVMVSPTPVPGAQGQTSSDTPSMESSEATSWPIGFGVTPTITPVPELKETEDSMSGAYNGNDVTVAPFEPGEDGAGDLPEQESGTLSGSGTATEGTATQGGTGATGEITGTDNQPRKVDLSQAKKDQTEEYIPYFDPDAGAYVLYEQSELLTKAEEAGKDNKKPVSVNEKVARSGRMVEKYNPLANAMFDVEEDNKIGVGLLAVTLFVIAGLMVVLVIKQKPEKEKAE